MPEVTGDPAQRVAGGSAGQQAGHLLLLLYRPFGLEPRRFERLSIALLVPVLLATLQQCLK